MKLRYLILCLGILLIIGVCISIAQDPNTAAVENKPRQILMPKDKKLPVRYRCPVHGITTITMTIECDGVKKVYCKKCALKLVSDFFDLNLPKLEVINEKP